MAKSLDMTFRQGDILRVKETEGIPTKAAHIELGQVYPLGSFDLNRIPAATVKAQSAYSNIFTIIYFHQEFIVEARKSHLVSFGISLRWNPIKTTFATIDIILPGSVQLAEKIQAEITESISVAIHMPWLLKGNGLGCRVYHIYRLVHVLPVEQEIAVHIRFFLVCPGGNPILKILKDSLFGIGVIIHLGRSPGFAGSDETGVRITRERLTLTVPVKIHQILPVAWIAIILDSQSLKIRHQHIPGRFLE